MDERARQLSAVAARLLEVPAVRLTALAGGANAAVFKVTGGDQTAVLKAYPEVAGDGRDRRLTEWRALNFLADAGVTAVPRPLATDAAGNLSLLAWCPGRPVTRSPMTMSSGPPISSPDWPRFGPAGGGGADAASEACLSAEDVATQITRRHGRLRDTAVAHADFHAFLADHLAPAADRTLAAARRA